MRLEVMGEGRLLDDEGRVCLGPGVPLLLLAYLATQPRPVQRDDLAVLFWPGKPRPLALQSLRQALTRLRAVLPGGILVESGRSLCVAPGSLHSDVKELEEAAAAGVAERALAAWGGRFLQGLRSAGGWELERWHDLEQTRLEARLAGAVLNGVTARREAGDVRGARTLLLRARTCLPADLTLVEALFRCLLEEGNRVEARSLLEELDMEDEGLLAGRLRETLEMHPLPGPEFGPRNRPDPVASGGPLEPPPEPGREVDAPGGRVRRVAAGSLMAVLLLAAGLAAGGRLTHAIRPDLPPNPAPDHLLVFCTSMATEGGDEQLYRMTLDGLHKHRISSRPGCESVWVPDPGGILFRENGTHGLFLLQPDRSNPQAAWTETRIRSPEGVAGADRLWGLPRTWTEAVDGRGVLLTLHDPEAGRTLLALLDPEADRTFVLLDLPGVLGHPAWDPMNREVLFAWSGGGSGSEPGAPPGAEPTRHRGEGLWALPLPEGMNSTPSETGVPYRLTASPTRDSRPNPRGEEVLLVRGLGEGNHKGDMEIHLLHRTRGESVVVTARPWNELDPVWSPDGRRLCWQSEEFGHFESQLVLGEPRGGTRVHLTRGEPGRQANCLFAPDGEHLVYRGTSATGSAAIMLTERTGRVHRDLSRTRWDASPLYFIPRRDAGEPVQGEAAAAAPGSGRP